MAESKPDPDAYPEDRTAWAIALIPEFSLGIFVAVMILALLRNGGPYIYGAWLIPVLWVTLISLLRAKQHSRAQTAQTASPPKTDAN